MEIREMTANPEDKYRRITDVRYWVAYYTKQAETHKKEIESKIKDLEYAVANKAREESELKALRKKFGLIE